MPASLLALGIIAPDLPAALWIAFVRAAGWSRSWTTCVKSRRCGGSPRISRACGAVRRRRCSPGTGSLLAAAATLAIAWMANLYNFMDGSDGLAGGMALIGFSFYGAAAWLAGSAEFALVNFSIAAAAAAFLVFNFHPARIFMGDAGSVPAGLPRRRAGYDRLAAATTGRGGSRCWCSPRSSSMPA